MRKHDVRKWIHAVLDMLPLFIIPIFAIYMHRHSVTNYEVVTGGYEITENYETNEVNTLSDIQLNKIYHYDYFNIFLADVERVFAINVLYAEDFYNNSSTNDVNDISFDNYDSTLGNFLYIEFFGNAGSIRYTNQNAYVEFYCTDFDIELINFDFVIVSGLDDFKSFILDDSNLLPTSSTYQSYNVTYNERLTYNDTDIGSQFVYALYLPIEKYFNFNNVATFNNMYQWFTTNFFNGEVPLVVPIVWNIILYEFIMDVLFLIYAVFMFIIDFVECLIDKAFGKSYRGGR